MLIAIVFISMPHYGATLLRVYERREERRAYALFTVYATILLAAAFYWGIHSVLVGTVLFTLYLTWSPWHYTGQNYGIALMILARRGITLTASQKRLVYASFVLSFVVTFFFIHGQTTSIPYDAQMIQYYSLNINATAADLLLFVALLGYAVTLGGSLFSMFRQGGRDALSAAVLMLTQGVWFVVPALVRNWFPGVGVAILTNGWAAYAFTWIALGHALQYLWITAYFANATTPTQRHRTFYAKALLVGCGIWTIPVLLFSPAAIGNLPYDIGLAATLAAVVNLHHFILDGAIWKLRHSQVARILLKIKTELSATTPEPAGATWTWRLVAAGGALSIVIAVFGIFEQEFGLNRALASNDRARAARAADRLAWIGQDSPTTWLSLGRLAFKDGELDGAVAYLENGVRVYDTTAGWMVLAEVREARRELPEAIDAYLHSIALDNDNSLAKMLLARAYASHGERQRARWLLEEDERNAEPGSLRYQRVRAELVALLALEQQPSASVSNTEEPSSVAASSESQ
jgi:hypothetical protein